MPKIIFLLLFSDLLATENEPLTSSDDEKFVHEIKLNKNKLTYLPMEKIFSLFLFFNREQVSYKIYKTLIDINDSSNTPKEQLKYNEKLRFWLRYKQLFTWRFPLLMIGGTGTYYAISQILWCNNETYMIFNSITLLLVNICLVFCKDLTTYNIYKYLFPQIFIMALIWLVIRIFIAINEKNISTEDVINDSCYFLQYGTRQFITNLFYWLLVNLNTKKITRENFKKLKSIPIEIEENIFVSNKRDKLFIEKTLY